MKQWDVYIWEFPHGQHPAVILTPSPWAEKWSELNVLACSSQRAQRRPEAHEILLDGEDGLDWETLCRCHRVFTAPRTELTRYRGRVSVERRRAIGRTLIRVLGLYVE
jgi:mRNA-degrading endonuclease toxin of MazEF toxin-antitoxin module